MSKASLHGLPTGGAARIKGVKNELQKERYDLVILYGKDFLLC